MFRQPSAVQHAVERPFEAHQADGRSRLVDLLKQTTIRASKDDLITLTKCFRKVHVRLSASALYKTYPGWLNISAILLQYQPIMAVNPEYLRPLQPTTKRR